MCVDALVKAYLFEYDVPLAKRRNLPVDGKDDGSAWHLLLLLLIFNITIIIKVMLWSLLYVATWFQEREKYNCLIQSSESNTEKRLLKNLY